MCVYVKVDSTPLLNLTCLTAAAMHVIASLEAEMEMEMEMRWQMETFLPYTFLLSTWCHRAVS